MRFLVNPAAGGGRARRALKLVERCAAGRGAEVEVSSSGDDLSARAERAVGEGVERLVVVGGDGTVHLAIQALAESNCELAIVPAGRGDDFACSIGVPRSAGEALKLAVDGASRPVDLLRLERPGGAIWAGVYVGVGLDSAVTDTANRQPRWIPPSLTYVLAAIRTLMRYRAPRMTVEHDGGHRSGPMLFVSSCNAPRYGGGMRMAPDACMDDGRFELVTADSVSRFTLLRLLPRVYSGTHTRHPAVSIFPTRRARIGADRPVLVGCDGEILGASAGPVEISISAGALRAVGAAREVE